jgi:hypothetical protein
MLNEQSKERLTDSQSHASSFLREALPTLGSDFTTAP